MTLSRESEQSPNHRARFGQDICCIHKERVGGVNKSIKNRDRDIESLINDRGRGYVVEIIGIQIRSKLTRRTMHDI